MTWYDTHCRMAFLTRRFVGRICWYGKAKMEKTTRNVLSVPCTPPFERPLAQENVCVQDVSVSNSYSDSKKKNIRRTTSAGVCPVHHAYDPTNSKTSVQVVPLSVLVRQTIAHHTTLLPSRLLYCLHIFFSFFILRCSILFVSLSSAICSTNIFPFFLLPNG